MSAPVRTLTYARNVWRFVLRHVGEVGEYNGRPFQERSRNVVLREAPAVINSLNATIRSYEDAERLGVTVPEGTALQALRASFAALSRVRNIILADAAGQIWDEMMTPSLERVWDSMPGDVRQTLSNEFADLMKKAATGILGLLALFGIGWVAVQALKGNRR